MHKIRNEAVEEDSACDLEDCAQRSERLMDPGNLTSKIVSFFRDFGPSSNLNNIIG